MRVVSGDLRGRRVEAPAGTATRPTTDKVREAVFNALGSLDLVLDARVADLYAGSGALGIEALSRGAAHCTFVERDRSALAVLRANLDHLDLTDRSLVVAGPALVHAGGLDVDLVFADPPYGQGAGDELWSELLAALPGSPFVVAESGECLEAVEGWEIVRQKRYGRTWITFLQRP